MELKLKNKPLQLRLWHGTRANAPIEIYSKDGFNVNFASNGALGKGIYTAVDASYSCSGY